jgi:SOS-response transcriptional repressor LexA
VITVDPGYARKDGAYVVVEYAGDVFSRQLVIDGERRILKPLNPK